MASHDLERNLIQRVNVGDMLTRSAWRLGDKEAVIAGDERLTYRALNDRVNALAHALLDAGYGRGTALLLISGNSIDFLVTYYACAKTGTVCVPINLAWGPKELAYVLGHAKARGAVVEAQLVPLISGALAIAENHELVDVIVAPGTGVAWEPAPQGTWHTLDAFVDASATSEPVCFVDDRDPLTYLYTSGTTSAPKGVVSSHVAVYIESLTGPIVMHYSDDDRSAVVMPLFHTAQLNGLTTGLIYLGGTVVLHRSFDAGALLASIERERITQIFLLPMMYRALIEHPEVSRRDLSSLRLGIYAMAPMAETDIKRVTQVLGCDLALGFGQTEMNPLTTVLLPEQQLSHAGAVGSAVPNVQVAIVDDAGELVPAYTRGEIVYRGPHAMQGYLHDEQATNEAFAGGWFHSGDVGYLDADGVLWFEDRRKDVIKTGGENVASLEVERALYGADPRIDEVVVVGLPHAHWTEAVVAIVRPRPDSGLTESDVLDAARSVLPGFKVPKAVILVDELPRTATGKVQKHLLRTQFRDYFASPAGPTQT